MPMLLAANSWSSWPRWRLTPAPDAASSATG